MAVAVDAVQPQRDLREFQRHRVQVHAEHAAVRDAVAGALQFVGVVGVLDGAVQFALLPVPPTAQRIGTSLPSSSRWFAGWQP